MKYIDIVDEIIERVDSIRMAPIRSGVPYVLTFKEALQLFLTDLEDDVISARETFVPALTEEEIANQAFDKQLDKELYNDAAQEAFDKKIDEETDIFQTGLDGWLSTLDYQRSKS